jgi:hypothetical protein
VQLPDTGPEDQVAGGALGHAPPAITAIFPSERFTNDSITSAPSGAVAAPEVSSRAGQRHRQQRRRPGPPGAERPVHDKKAEWVWGVLDELEKAGLVTLADKGYQGSTWAKVPYRGRNKPEPQKEANHAHAKLRAPR